MRDLHAEADNYKTIREGLMDKLRAVEQERETSSGSAFLSVGPGGNSHALDQLRVITSASRAAARTKNEPAKDDSGSGFDTESSFAPADLPYVAAPDAATPLEVAPPATRQPESPAGLKGSHVLSAFEQEQNEDLSKLDQLYKERLQLKEQGANASSEEWTKVANGIWATQAHLNYVTVAQRLSKGSALMDLTITPKAQKKLPEPPPPTP